MSGHYYPPHSSAPDDEEYQFDPSLHPQLAQQQQAYQIGLEQSMMPMVPQQQIYMNLQQYYPVNQQQTAHLGYPNPQPQPWVTPVVPSNYAYTAQSPAPFPPYTEPSRFPMESASAGPSTGISRYLSPEEVEPARSSRATSNASDLSLSDMSRSVSPNASEMARWGRRNQDGSWSCSFPGCSSRSTFHRGCDLRKHYKRHTKSLFCRHEGCPQATEGGFSSKKDRARHEASHNPTVPCEWPGCERMFSRTDNMKDHVRRVHRRGQR